MDVETIWKSVVVVARHTATTTKQAGKLAFVAVTLNGSPDVVYRLDIPINIVSKSVGASALGRNRTTIILVLDKENPGMLNNHMPPTVTTKLSPSHETSNPTSLVNTESDETHNPKLSCNL